MIEILDRINEKIIHIDIPNVSGNLTIYKDDGDRVLNDKNFSTIDERKELILKDLKELRKIKRREYHREYARKRRELLKGE